MPHPLPSLLTLTPTHPLALIFFLLLQGGSRFHALYMLFSLLRILFPQLVSGWFLLIVGLGLSSKVTCSEKPFRTTQASSTSPLPLPFYYVVCVISSKHATSYVSLTRLLPPRAGCDCRVHCRDPSAENST